MKTTIMKKNIKVLLITHAIAPYRIPLFNFIHKVGNFDFKVFSLVEREKNREWKINKNDIIFNHQILPGYHFFIWGDKREVPIHFNRSVLKSIFKYNPDMIITAGYDTVAYWIAFLYCKLLNRKYILWNESSLLSVGSVKGIRGFLKRVIVKGADKYIAFGTKAKEYLVFLGAKPKDIFTSVNTVDLKYFKKEVERYKYCKDFTSIRKKYPKILLLYVGQLIKRKGVNQILKAFNIIKDPDIGFLIVGNGPEAENLKKICKKYELKNVFFEGFCQKEKLPKYYALADIFILASFQEVWGLVINEALASGLYVLSSKYTGSSYDLIKERWNGEVFDPYDINEIVKLIKQVKEKIEDIRKKREDVSQHACENFNIEIAGETFLKAIKEVC